MIYIRKSRRAIAVTVSIAAVSALAIGFVHREPATTAMSRLALASSKSKATCACSSAHALAGVARARQSGPGSFSFVQFLTGQTRQLKVDFSSGLVAAGGTWTARWGSIDAQGNYTAPPMLPPAAQDNIDYVDPSGNTAEILVDIVPDPNVQGSSTQPYVVNSALPPDPYYTNTGVTANAAKSAVSPSPTSPVFTLAQATFPSGAIVYEPIGATPEPPVSMDVCEDEAVITIGSDSGEYIPSMGSTGTNATLIYVRADPTKPQIKKCAKTGPHNPRQTPKGNCTGTSITQPGGAISTSDTPSPWKDFGKVTVNVSANLALEINSHYNIGISAGANIVTDLQEQIHTYKRAQWVDTYGCSNGHWQFLFTQYCTQTATGVVTIPQWYDLALGYDVNGAPGPYTPWVCQTNI